MQKFCAIVTLAIATSFYAHAQTEATLTDREIAETLITINEGEIDAGQIASRKAQRKDVKDFAKMMVDEHKKNEKETKKVVKNAKIDPKDSNFTEAIEDEAEVANKELKKADKKDFDKVYLAQQIKMHEKALATITDTLLPNTKNPDLRLHLEKTQAAVKMHLEHVKQLDTIAQ